MPRRLDVKQRRIIYDLLARMEGEYCLACFAEGVGRRGPPEVNLEIDHANGDPSDWSGGNIHLVCKTHNLKFRRLSSKEHVLLMAAYSDVNVSVCMRENRDPRKIKVVEEVDLKTGSPELRLNNIYEPGWLTWMHQQLTSYGNITRKEAINAGAAAQRCSNTTTARYCDVHTSSEGVFEEFTDGSGHRAIRYRKIEPPKPKAKRKK